MKEVFVPIRRSDGEPILVYFDTLAEAKTFIKKTLEQRLGDFRFQKIGRK